MNLSEFEKTLLEEIRDNLKFQLELEEKDNKYIDFYFSKLRVLVLDYTRQEELNRPLACFIENKIYNFIDTMHANNSSNNAEVDVRLVKSIQRGDTTITYRDANKIDIEDSATNDPTAFTKTDYALLNRHRRVYRQ